MRKRILIVASLFLVCSFTVRAQNTNVTATVTDAGGQTWNNGTYTFNFVPAPRFNGTYRQNGNPFTPPTITGTLSAAGAFTSIAIPDNNQITPSGTQWSITLCPQGSGSCFISNPIVITGASQTITSSLIPPAILVSCGSGVAAYADVEVQCGIGGQYYNLTSQIGRVCQAASGNTCTLWAAAGGGITSVPSLPGTCTVGQQFVITGSTTVWTCGPLANQYYPSGAANFDGPVASGLVAQYQINPTDTVASLKDYSGAGNNATGTVGIAPTIIANSGGLQCGGGGGVILPAALNSMLTVQAFVGYQNTTGVSATNDQSWMAGNGNGTTSNAIQFMLSANGTSGFPAAQPAASRQVVKFHNSYSTASLDTFYGNDVITWALGANDILYQGQVLSTSGGGNIFGTSAGGQTVGAYQLCGAAAGSGNTFASYFSGQIYYVLIYNRVLSSNDIAQNVAFMRAQMAARGVSAFENQTGTVNNLVVLGDSISVTTGLSTSPYNLLSLYDTWNVTNNSVSGQTICGMVPNAVQTIDPLYSPNATRNVVILASISNDISQVTPNYLAVLQCTRQFVQARHNVGWKVLLVTMLDRGNVQVQKNTWNTLIRQMWANIGADGLIDYAANPNIGADGANANATYFQDTIHPTTLAVNTIMAPMASFIVNRLFGNSYNSGAPVVAKNQAAGTFLQQYTLVDSSNLVSRTVTFNNPNYPGSLLTLVTRANPTSVTDSNGNAWAQRAAFGGGGLWDAVNVKGGEPNSVTITLSSANVGEFTLAEYSGVTASPFDVQASNSGSGTAMTGGGPTTTVANDLVLGVGFTANTATTTAGGGATVRNVPASANSFLEDVIFVGPGAVTASATTSISGSWNMITAAYKTLANTTYPMGAQDTVLYCSPGGGSQTINLPEAQYLAGGGTAFGGGTITIKNVQTAGANTCTVAGINAETIDGAASVTVANKATLIVKAVLVSPSAAGANWIQVQNN
jgi:hypothetical protein